MKKSYVIAAIVATIALAFGVFAGTKAILSSRHQGAGPPVAFTPGADAVRPIQVHGDALPRYANPTADVAIGRLLPILVGRDFSGHPVTVDHGKPTIVVVVSHWCAVCQRTIPELAASQHQGKINAAVRIVVLSTAASASSPNWPPQTWLHSLGWTGETIVDDAHSTAAMTLGAPTYPFFLGADAHGVVVFRSSGDISTSELQQLSDLIAHS